MQDQDETVIESAEIPPAPSSPAAAQQPYEALRQTRSKCLTNYHAQALSQQDPLLATIGGLTAGMVEIAHWLEDAIHEVIDGQPATMDIVRKVNPAIETHLRLLRQVDRFVAQLQKAPQET